LLCLLACCLAGLVPQTARADDDNAPKPAPRTAIAIGGASVVLVAAADHLYAFIDCTEDNTPVADAELGVASADGATLSMSKAAAGLFVAPFDRAGHMRDAFMVTLHSAVGSGDAQAEIAYDDLPDAAGGDAGTGFGTKLAIAVLGAGIGAIASASAMLWLRDRRKRGARPALGSARPA